jgi:uncharacterized peroxidase-related enzyme
MAIDEQDALLVSLVEAPLEHVAVSGADQALVRYAERLTLTPGSVGAADVDELRAAGLDDRAIHDACAIVAYFAFVNRIADGLGVELESSSGAR